MFIMSFSWKLFCLTAGVPGLSHGERFDYSRVGQINTSCQQFAIAAILHCFFFWKNSSNINYMITKDKCFFKSKQIYLYMHFKYSTTEII